MKTLQRSLLLLCTAMLALSTAAAERITTGYRLGYCHGRMDEECQFSYDGEKQISAAIHISATEVDRLAGNCIAALRLAVHSKIKVESLTVWVASSLDDQQCQNTVTRKELSTGWNVIPLASPYLIEGGQDLYVGYTYSQSAQSYVISAPQAQSPLTEAFWLKTGDEPWSQPADDQTALSLEALLEGDRLPQYDLQLASLSLLSDSVQSGQDLYLTGHVRVDGLQPVQHFGIHAQSDAFEDFNLDLTQPMNYGEEHTFCLRIPTDDQAMVADGLLSVQITDLDGVEDEWQQDNTFTHNFTAKPDIWQRTVLCEEFTSEPCGNCPRVANWLAEAHATYPLAHRVQIAAHHVGFADDFLTVEESRPYTGFFWGVPSNPAMMCDRNSDPLADGNIVYMPESVKEIMTSWSSALSRPATVALSLYASKLEDNVLSLHVRGERSADCQLADAHLTVMVVEDSIAAHYQSGAGVDWIHQHAVRAISDSWGTPISWQDDDTFATDLELTIPETAVPAHCTVVAFVSENAERTKERYIENTLAVPLCNAFAAAPQTHEAAIHAVSVEPQATGCYSLHGILIRGRRPTPGLYIQDGRKVIFNF